MKKRLSFFLLAPVIAICACDPVPVQYPPGASPYPYPAQGGSATPLTQAPEVTGSQRWAHAWSKAMEGVAMGGSIGGPYGAGGGLVIGLLTGLLTADSHYGQINNQIHAEQKKDQQLEAAIEQELARQRELESKIENAAVPAPTTTPPTQPVAAKTQPERPARTQASASTHRSAENTNVAALTKPVTTPTAPTPFKNVEVRDVNGDGVPDLWIYYNPQRPSEIIRQEEASQADGRVNTWSYFKDGKMVRREVDSKQAGRPDTVYFYHNDKIIREERDETGQGTMTYRASYQDGRLAKVERDSTSSGRPDLWVYYDTTGDGEIIVKEERDLDGDGVPDLWSYFENGRLARRDVSAVALDILSKREQLPAPAAKLTHASIPGS